MNHFAISGILTGVSSLFFGLFVYFRGRTKPTNQLWALFAITVSAWGFGASWVAAEQDPRYSLLAWRLAYSVGVVWIAPLFYHFVCAFLSIHRLKVLISQYAIATIFLGFIWTKLHFTGVRYVFDQFYCPTPGYLFPCFFLWWSALVLLAHYELLKAFKTAGGMQRPITTFFLATSIGYSGGSLSYLPIFGIDLYPWGTYAIPVYTVIMAYGILQYRLFDIRLVIRRSFAYSILVTSLTVGYFALVYGIERIFQTAFGYQSVWLSLLAFALMGLLFQPLKIWIQRLVDWLIYQVPQEQLIKRMERFEQEAHQGEKMKAVATLAAGLCHELRNPLQAIYTHAEFLPERFDDPQFRKSCSEIMKTEITRINGLLKQLMDFAKPKAPSLRPIEPHKILDSTLDFLNNEFVTHQISLEKRYEADDLQIQADPDQLRQVILNLALNALQAIGKNGQITVTTHQEDGWFTLEVMDTGPGIDPAILPKLFEPFTTTKPSGTGLGLSIVHSIVREHRGKITAQSQPGKGTTFTIKLPV